MSIDFSLLNIVVAGLASWDVMLMMLVGVIGGIVIGALPGLSATMGIALLILITFGMNPIAALVLLSAIYTAAVYGGSITAILLHTPGTPASRRRNGHGRIPDDRAWRRPQGAGHLNSLLDNRRFRQCHCLAYPGAASGPGFLEIQRPGIFPDGRLGLTIISSLSSGALVKGLSAVESSAC